MKKLFFMLAVAFTASFMTSCEKEDEFETLYSVTLALEYPEGYEAAADVKIAVKNSNSGTSYSQMTDESGEASFELPAGVYEASSTEQRSANGTLSNLNGLQNFTVGAGWNASQAVAMSLTASKASQIIIKELYCGGCPKDDGSGSFSYGQYVILYNNSDMDASLDNLCFATTHPSNSNSTSSYSDENGNLTYESTGVTPAGYGIWHFPTNVMLEARTQVVVALTSAIDNSTTYSQAPNFASSSYWAAYDIEDYYHASNYPAPAAEIPSSQYLNAERFAGASGSAWVMSGSSPGLFIFVPEEGVTPADFANDASKSDDTNYAYSGTQLVPNDWILDAVDVFRQGYDNYKRFSATIDAGSVVHTSKLGYSIYRNVDKDATEAIEENTGKLVYNYALGTTDTADGSTDTSSIDAEASMANGAIIIYKDTNSSSNDFHQRSKASIRDYPNN
ncbi:MAG: DUF4876 domain-containing protein [Mangrovibacterium sp.]